MVKDIIASRFLEWHCLLTKFHEIFQAVRKLLVGDKQTDRLVI
jgi:hypothetical protein